MEVKHKFSRKRQRIYEALKSTYDHPSAEMLYSRLKSEMPELSLATVYRNLATFVEEGNAISLGTVNGQERFDGEVHAHPHAICRSCGKVTDVPGGTSAELPVIKNFAVEAYSIVYYGVCSDCSNR